MNAAVGALTATGYRLTSQSVLQRVDLDTEISARFPTITEAEISEILHCGSLWVRSQLQNVTHRAEEELCEDPRTSVMVVGSTVTGPGQHSISIGSIGIGKLKIGRGGTTARKICSKWHIKHINVEIVGRIGSGDGQCARDMAEVTRRMLEDAIVRVSASASLHRGMISRLEILHQDGTTFTKGLEGVWSGSLGTCDDDDGAACIPSSTLSTQIWQKRSVKQPAQGRAVWCRRLLAKEGS
ncbi:hypothetical protein DFJ58DRAFT_839699 [Suillus subalutaceus]|uniref:uncharacterized protein n=1 Tax=Suillus subalutaceus TaxID=48586 RepID=UPI001B87CE57|nr:uncharacterized protein DFJ58DRAFT_839699 [Suillus subalutaceus]KAG1861565.1 hypothetical protein DFJ58DRAFT_839699 [Suillus subalutaceus]